jgi:GT2 family glycosyltransferase
MVSIVIVSFNTKDLLKSCLDSIPAGTGDLPYEIIVVDNGSEDGSTDLIKNYFPSVELIESKKNLGFSRANNEGAKCSKGDALLFLNSDTVVQKGAIFILYNTLMSERDIGIVGPKILNSQGKPTRSYMQFLTLPMLFAGSEKLSWLFEVEKYRQHFRNYDFSNLREVPWLSGACLMIKRDLFFAVGGFDENYFFYCEDMDLCLQVYRHGYRVMYVPTANIVHLFGGSSQKKRLNLTSFYRQSMVYYFKKNFSFAHAFLARLLLLLHRGGRK